MRSRVLVAIIIIISSFAPNQARAAIYADCVITNGGELRSEFGELVYVLEASDGCTPGVRSYSFTFSPNAGSSYSDSQSNVILYSYAKDLEFRLGSLQPGEYSPTLRIRSNQDIYTRSVRLPSFTIESPIMCISLSRSTFNSAPESTILSLVLTNTCPALPASSFSIVNVELEGRGLEGVFSNYQSLYSVSEYGSTVKFALNGLRSGTYYPALRMTEDGNASSRVIALEPFVIPTKTTITCAKGKLLKKVIGLNPKCPAGYKKK